MEKREVQSPAGGLQVQQPQQMLMGHISSSYHSNSSLISSNPTANIPPSFPFNSLTSPLPGLQRHEQQNQHHQQQPKPLDSLNSGEFNGSPQFRYNTEPVMKKKRGTPRKYAQDGNIALLQLAPTTPIASNSADQANHGAAGDSVGLGTNSGVAGGGAASEPSAKKNRGRPAGSCKKQIDALGGVGGVGFTLHVITVETGEDIASKIMDFSQQGPRTVCILSANGAISNVTLRQPSMSGGTVTYEGCYEIISLSGSLFSENNGNRSRSGGLSVSLAGSDGRVLGGGVAGMLRAASPVQVIVSSFIADRNKQSSDVFKTEPSSTLTSNMLNIGAPGMTGSPPSQGRSSKSSDENGGSPLNRGSGFYDNSAPSIHNNNNMQMYQLWNDHTPQ